jgi:hypothetical protein
MNLFQKEFIIIVQKWKSQIPASPINEQIYVKNMLI